MCLRCVSVSMKCECMYLRSVFVYEVCVYVCEV